ncbi:hypothetical protein QBC40DRAFT_28504 [Triangularia verruculosa]|uniref:Uncharacterized protein n=1 Tax=Triangularia verruculosa TaxID=2587418 RepID=A0AAN7AN03_9PEZI|nr:hypothetical protein QBC40DRAFT_28504 [Triangularia verruculosa]
MASPHLDPSDIHNFLRPYTASNEGYGYFQDSYDFRADAPRSVASATNDDLDGFESDQTYSEGQSYTSAPSVVSQAYTASTMQSSSPSVFSRWGYQSSTGQTSIASGRRSVVGQPVAAASADWVQHAGELWCEFSDFLGCTTTFRLNDRDSWTRHHIAHLRELYPVQSQCWFCDDFWFAAKSPGDLYPTFCDRMDHIHSHIADDHKTTSDTRRDFYVIEHMYQADLISDSEYHMARRYDELPAAYRLPGLPGAAPPSSSDRPPPNSSDRHRSRGGDGYSQGSRYRPRR